MRGVVWLWLWFLAASCGEAPPPAPALGPARPVGQVRTMVPPETAALPERPLDCSDPEQADRVVSVANDQLLPFFLTALHHSVTEAGEVRRTFTCRELAGIRELALGDMDNLAGIEVLSGLERLSAGNVARGGLAPLAANRRLRILELGFREQLSVDRPTSVGDLTPLRGLADLEILHVRGAHVRELAPIAALVQLRELDLELNLISDIEPLRSLPQLEKLNVADNAILELAPLRGLARLVALDLSGNQVKDIEVLGGLSSLQAIDLSGNPLRSVVPLARLSMVEEILLVRTAVHDVRPLQRLPRLRALYLCATPAETGRAWRDVNEPVVRALRQRNVKVIWREACTH
jgi:hypothetical protein